MHLPMFTSLLIFCCLCSTIFAQCGPCPDTCDCCTQGLVNCNTSDFTDVPRHLPNDTGILDLTGNNIQYLRPFAFAGLPNLTEVLLPGMGLSNSGITPLSFGKLKHLEVLDLSSNPFYEFPRFLPPSVSTLYVAGIGLTHVTNKDFINMTSIFILVMSYNKLVLIDIDAFLPVQNALYQVDVEFNNLTCKGIHGGAVFSNLTRLGSIYARFNPLGCLPANIPKTVISLDFVSTNITTIQNDSINHLSVLQDLSLWQNPIESIEDNAFDGVKTMTLLDLNTNKISIITNYTLKGLRSMEKLYLYENKIKSISTEAFLGMKNLQELWLSDNQLTRLDSAFMETFQLDSLNYIDITFNPFVCDCKLEWLKKYQEKNDKIVYPHIITCAAPRKLHGKGWDVLSHKSFTC